MWCHVHSVYRFRRLGSFAVMFLLAASTTILLAPPAWAVCNGTLGAAGIGADNPGLAFGQSTFGSRAAILVNDFGGSNQHQTWRQASVFQNSSNLVEAGWFVQASFDQIPHPYKTFVNDGQSSTVRFTGINISVGPLHNFAVKDPNDDSLWRFLFDGSPLGTDSFASVSNGHASALAESERFCTDDSLFAQFRSLQYIKVKNQGDVWINWLGPVGGTHGDVSPYQFCSVGQTAFDVRQSC
jgi:hypothetical protein